jgi:hypothetical protein
MCIVNTLTERKVDKSQSSRQGRNMIYIFIFIKVSTAL